MRALCASLIFLWVTLPSFAQEYGTPAEAKAMLEKAVAALKVDQAKALQMFTTGQGGFREKDLYPYCGGPDGNFTAHPTLVGKSLKDLIDKSTPPKPLGQEIYAAAQPGKISEVSYMWPRLKDGDPKQKLVQKVAYVTKVGDLVCAVGYYRDLSSLSPTSFVTTSRIFAGPNQYPPRNYAAYGIIAFSARAMPQTRPRLLMICEAYVKTIPHAMEISVPPPKQMVTVWPVETDQTALTINQLSRDILCESAVDNYGLVLALQAMKEAKFSGSTFSGRGPFLLAWSPGNDKGREDVFVLFDDLSNVTTPDQAVDEFRRWRERIEQNRELWENGWNVERVRREIRLWVDATGAAVLQLMLNSTSSENNHSP